MNYFVAESGGHRERATVDQGSRSCCGESTRVTTRATDTGEKRITCARCRRNRILTSRRTCCGHEVGEGKHVAAIVLGIRNRIKGRWERHVDDAFRGAGRVLVRSGIGGVRTSATKTVELAGDTHLI